FPFSASAPSAFYTLSLHDALPIWDLDLFLRWVGMDEQELLDCLRDKRDSRIWGKDRCGQWVLLDSVVNHVNDPGVDEVRLRKERSEEHTSELQSRVELVCRLLLEK